MESHNRYDDDCWIISDDEEEDVPNSATFRPVDKTGDVAISFPKANLKCPYTGKEMQIPVKNKRCKHRYDLEGILHHIKQKGRRARCPVAGCGNDHPVRKEDLQIDKELATNANLASFIIRMDGITGGEEEEIDNSDTFYLETRRPVARTGDIVMSSPTANLKCPFTGEEMKIPMKNKRCNHRYDWEGALDHIKQKGRQARCPVAGCSNDLPVKITDLDFDKELATEDLPCWLIWKLLLESLA